MVRLTEPIKNIQTGEALAYRVPCDVSTLKVWNKLGKYEDLEEQGFLKRIPVKVGERAYVFSKEWNRAYPITVVTIAICKDGFYLKNAYGESFHFGTESFLTFREAEAALKEMEEK